MLRIDRTNYNESKDEEKFLAEAHARLTTPLISLAMALLAILAVLGGNFNRRGYGRRIAITSSAALGLIIVQLAVQSASVSDRSLNVVQWLLPIFAIIILSFLIFWQGRNLGKPSAT